MLTVADHASGVPSEVDNDDDDDDEEEHDDEYAMMSTGIQWSV